MSTTSKTPVLEKNYSKFRKALLGIKTDELEVLADIYGMMCPLSYKVEIKAISDELELRSTSLGKELY